MTKKPPPPAKPNEPDYYNTVSEDLFIDKFIKTIERHAAQYQAEQKAKKLPSGEETKAATAEPNTARAPTPAKPTPEPDYYHTVSEELFVDKYSKTLKRLGDEYQAKLESKKLPPGKEPKATTAAPAPSSECKPNARFTKASLEAMGIKVHEPDGTSFVVVPTSAQKPQTWADLIREDYPDLTDEEIEE